MSREPTRLADLRDAPSPEAAYLKDVIRAQRRMRTPEAKMQELAARLEPILHEKRPPAIHALPWLGMSVAAVLLAGGVWIARPDVKHEFPPKANVQVEEEGGEPLESSVGAEKTTSVAQRPAETTAIEAPAAIPVDALPNANVRQATAPPAPRCDEIELVDRADVALRSGDPQRALSVVREHEQRCPSGALVQERERIAVEALARVGRIDAARARARAFEEHFPSSPHLRRVRQVVERLEGSAR